VAGAKVDSSTTDSGDDMWDATPPEEEEAAEEAADEEASYEGNPICHGFIFINFRICPKQEAEARKYGTETESDAAVRRKPNPPRSSARRVNYASSSDDDDFQ
jgi:hypothetical protein